MTHRKILVVVLWMTGALISFSATAIAVRGLSAAFSVAETLAFRNAAGIAILAALALARPSLRPDIAPRRIPLHLARNVVHFAATYAWTLGVTLLPLATVFALEFTTPAWVALLAVLLLRETMTTPRLVAIVLGFLGVLVIQRPGLATFEASSLVVLFSALGFALTAIATKKLVATESTFAILFMMNLMQLPMNLVLTGEAFWLKLGPEHLSPLAVICVSGLTSHWCLTNAYRNGDAIMVVPLDFLRIPLIALVGWHLYGEALDPFVLAGSLVIIAGILWNLRAEGRAAPAPLRAA
ncbi:MAG TPA: DMT family transporter [Microvirga sp.]|nr:DMT family transporter [Microvirga sp.]